MSNLENISTLLNTHGFSHHGFAALTKPLSIDKYSEWIDKNYYGNMEYLKDHLPTKENPKKILSSLQSAIVVTKKYYPNPKPHNLFTSLNIAEYAKNFDYHHWLKSELNTLASDLKSLYPSEEFLCYTDSGPVLERDLAYRAGLGWVGKNSCLIDKKEGSLFFIAEILTSLKLTSTIAPSPDHCGKCNLCVEACPTDALLGDKTMDATKCISYLTIENKKPADKNLRPKVGDLLFGCDICQTVCPWNQKIIKHELLNQNKPSKNQTIEELKQILTSSNKQLTKKIKLTPLNRAGAKGLKKNALVVAANIKAKELTSEIKTYTEHETLSQLAEWALSEIEKS